ncbi:DUF2267 domain-containing protein [Chthonobacter rhizosphaerae]|uniref:DUF2267 domain-containing protein n=1 Tax=Chthonobacter rhizosphaerae TaxID=2735553 RepID=UPI0015EE89EB|nr:DUF2267 domain-containing protein [Chthonobacter rhizosphaerae]
MNDLISRISSDVGISPDLAETAVRIILNFLNAEGPSGRVQEMAAELGVADYLGGEQTGGGMMGAIGGLFGGGGAMAAFSALSNAGLDMGQIQGVTRSFVDHAREKVGPETVNEIVDSIPGLSQFV